MNIRTHVGTFGKLTMNDETSNNHGPARDSLDSLPLSAVVREL